MSEHLQHVKKAVWEARPQWKDVGRSLGMNDGTICSIHDSDDGECLHKVLSLWIHSGKATIYDFLKALEDKTVGRHDIAHEIRARKGEDRSEVGLDPDTETDISNPPACKRRCSSLSRQSEPDN